ncbi:MAG: cytochrome c biogenesis protein CcdA [Candidatus Atribacteria bacterium]|nr:cytochrome c biogenesis protein CcdA [Candidatus Atribacteria bacterium]
MLVLSEVSLMAAFLAGLLSFISPCVLPLVPGYISFISGISLEDIENKKQQNKNTIIISSLFFIIGFSLVFILLGATATLLGSFLLEKAFILKKVAGLIIIFFGIHMSGLYRIKFLDYEKRIYTNTRPVNIIVGPFLMGLAFAFGWTPCIGPILAGILVYAGTQETVSQGILLLSLYSAGLGIPFLLTALAINKFYLFSNKIKKHFKVMEIVGGALLILIGGLILTDNLQKIVYYFIQ